MTWHTPPATPNRTTSLSRFPWLHHHSSNTVWWMGQIWLQPGCPSSTGSSLKSNSQTVWVWKIHGTGWPVDSSVCSWGIWVGSFNWCWHWLHSSTLICCCWLEAPFRVSPGWSLFQSSWSTCSHLSCPDTLSQNCLCFLTCWIGSCSAWPACLASPVSFRPIFGCRRRDSRRLV